MSKLTVGVVDYGIGNQMSVRHALHRLRFRCRVSDDPDVLAACNFLVFPGVGAFPRAMEALRNKGLDDFLIQQASAGKPILGICLGMQLLAESSQEGGETRGLGLIPGHVVPLQGPRWHIGWNTVDVVNDDALFLRSQGHVFFFNHSYVYQGPSPFHACRTNCGSAFASALRKDNVIGVQFHPEKSQLAGQALLRDIIQGLCRA